MNTSIFTERVLRCLSILLFIFATSVSQAGELTIYSSVEGDSLKDFASRFAKAYPQIKVNWVRDSTGVIQARAVAEKDNPRHDVFFGHAATNMLTFDAMNLFLPYSPKGVEKLDPRYRDAKSPPTWTGLWGFASAICFNTIEAKKKNIPAPVHWADLTKPIYKGQITMPNPASSGTGFLNVSGWLQLWGPEKAWAFMDGLDQNIASYSHSGSKPCEQAASGEYVVGISLPWRAATLKSMGAPIDIIIPEEGVGWEMQAVAIMKTTKNPEDAKIFVDWAVSEAAMDAYAKRTEVVAFPGKSQGSEYLPPELASRMIKNDFASSAQNLPFIITEWRKRYDVKTEPKK